MRAVITGGGTGGHIYPALAVAKKLKAKGWDVLYMGSTGGLEGEIVPDSGIEYKEISVAPFYRKFTLKLLISFLKTTKGLIQSLKIIKKYKADIVLGTGGFVSGPVVLAGSLLSIPTIIHEQNVYPGITNRILAHRVDAVALNFKNASEHFTSKAKDKFVVTGNPIRLEIINTCRNDALNKLNLAAGKKTILVFGGSQGAQSINEAMFEVYKYYQKSKYVQIIHITGSDNYEMYCEMLSKLNINIEKHFHIFPYLKEMNLAYAAADLVVYRAGATGIAEITARGIAAILIPYPYATGDHQNYNARTMANNGAAVVISDEDLNACVLLNKIDELIKNESKLKTMSKVSEKLGNKDAVENIIKLINKVVNEC